MSTTIDLSGASNVVEILLVDDREENLLALEAALQSPHYKLVKASSGDKALRYLLDHKPALILLDVQMPKLDGYETATLIKGSERTRDIPIIFLTALNEEELLIQKGYESGAVDYVIKPFNSEILRSKVKVFSDLHCATQRLLRLEREMRESEARVRERKMAELELRSLRREQIHQRKYHDLVQGIDHGIVWAANPKSMSFSFVGPTAEQLLGYSCEQWLGEPDFWQNHIHPDDATEFANRCRKALEEHAGFSVDHRFFAADGKLIWLHTGVRICQGLDSSGLELRGLSIDITKLKHAEAALYKNKLRSDLLAQASLSLANSSEVNEMLANLGKMLVPSYADWLSIELINEVETKTVALECSSWRNSAGRLAEFNSAATRSTAFAPTQLTYHRQISESTRLQLAGSQVRANLMKDLKSAVVIPILIQSRSFGTMIIGSTQRESFFDGDDICFMTSLICRVATALENARLYEEAQAAVRIRDEFLSIASHELKTPLTPLKLQIQQLIRTMGSSTQSTQEAITKLLGTSNRQITRLSRLIEDLLDISRINRGQLELELTDFSLDELIRDIISRFARQLEEADCIVSLDLSEPLSVHWDRMRTEQVVTNLLTNSIKYAPGKPIRIIAKQKNDKMIFSIRDEGMGIALEDQQRIFKRFERAVSQTHFGGLGLGLYIVSQIVDRHEGIIHVESQPGHGAEFIIEIPAAGPRHSTAPPVSIAR